MSNQTTISLDALEINNFKGIKQLRIDFLNKQTNVWGQNASGKTSISDAYHWLLTGKNSLDQEKFSLKNTFDTSLNRNDHDVTGFFRLNNEKIKLRRVLKENWVKPKGQIDLEYKGNSQEYFYNDVPVQAGEYSKKIAAFLDENILKMVSNPFYFTKLKWQDQRAVLSDMAGKIENTDILDKIATLKNKAQIFEITNVLNSNKLLSEYKAQLNAQKKLAKLAIEKIPTRIDEAARSMPEIEDYAAIETRIKELENSIADIDILISDQTAAFNKKNQVNIENQKQINTLQLQISAIENEVRNEKSKAQNDYNFKIQELENKISTCTASINSKNLLIESTQERINTLTERKTTLLAEFAEETKKVLVYDEHKFTCPTCMRALEVDNIEAAKIKMQENFISERKRVTDAINVNGKAIAVEIKQAGDLIASIRGQLDPLQTELILLNDELDLLKDSPVKLEAFDNELTNRQFIVNNNIKALQAKIEDVEPIDLTEAQSNKALYKIEIKELENKLTGKEQREKIEKRIVELRNEEGVLAQQIADFEATEFTISEFDRAMIEETNRRVSGLFEYVKFKLFDYTVDQNPIETCQAMYKDVPYGDLNTAGKVWAGVDIINALSKYYAISAPIFLDGRESVSEIPSTDAQIINLIVSPSDKVLRIE